jgi:hypothetical protein
MFIAFVLQVRGVGAGGIVSSAYCLLYKLYTLKLTRKQLMGLITHKDSPYIRGLGFMYIRLVLGLNCWKFLYGQVIEILLGSWAFLCYTELRLGWAKGPSAKHRVGRLKMPPVLTGYNCPGQYPPSGQYWSIEI